MFSEMFSGWFQNTRSNYNAFIKAMLCGNIKEMNAYMNEVALSTFSSFDTELLDRGIKKSEIRHYGFAFEGKKVLIGND